jgi:hypothetical protein
MGHFLFFDKSTQPSQSMPPVQTCAATGEKQFPGQTFTMAIFHVK